MGMAPHFKTIAYTDASPVFSRSLCRGDSWTNGAMHAIRRVPHQRFDSMIKFFVLDVLLRQVVAVSSDPAPDSAFAPPFFGRPSGQLP